MRGTRADLEEEAVSIDALGETPGEGAFGLR